MANDIVLGAKTIPNPKGIKISADTDNPPVNPAGRDTGNATQLETGPKAEPYVSDPFHMLGIRSGLAKPRHQLGRFVPKNHPAISEN